MAIIPIELLKSPQPRTAGSAKDFNMANAYAENKGSEEEPSWYVRKRPGLTLQNDYSTAGQGRAIFSWEDHVWAVFGDTVYKDGVALTTNTLATTTGKVYFQPTATSLLLQDPTVGNIYEIAESDTALPSPEADPDIPTPQYPGIEVLDTFVFVCSREASSNNGIFNSEAGDATTWLSTSFLTPEIKPDDVVRLGRHINYIVTVGEDSVEFFRDAGNTTGSVLNRIDGYVTLLGAPAGSGDCYENIDDEVYFIAQSDNGGRFVAKYRSLTPERVSNQAVEEALDAEGTDISDAYAYTIRFNGNNFYVLNLPTTANKTFVLNITDGMWSEWSSVVTASENFFNIRDATLHQGATLLQDLTSGEVYTLDNTAFQDDGEDIYVEIQTDRFDGDTFQNKFMWRLAVDADQEASSPTPTLGIAWSDDDYQTFTTNRNVDLSVEEPFLTRCGSFKKRAWRFQHRVNTPLRIKGIRAHIDLGHHGL